MPRDSNSLEKSTSFRVNSAYNLTVFQCMVHMVHTLSSFAAPFLRLGDDMAANSETAMRGYVWLGLRSLGMRQLEGHAVKMLKLLPGKNLEQLAYLKHGEAHRRRLFCCGLEVSMFRHCSSNVCFAGPFIFRGVAECFHVFHDGFITWPDP